MTCKLIILWALKTNENVCTYIVIIIFLYIFIYWPSNGQYHFLVETSPLINKANQKISFYMELTFDIIVSIAGKLCFVIIICCIAGKYWNFFKKSSPPWHCKNWKITIFCFIWKWSLIWRFFLPTSVLNHFVDT